MIAVLQRVSSAKVVISDVIHAEIGKGFLVLLGIETKDTHEDVGWLAQKIVNMRIFGDQGGKMNLDLLDIGGEILLVSQFTLHALTKKGNRPSFIEAARPEQAIPLYSSMISVLSTLMPNDIKTGVFGADMQVSLCNDGPVTILLDSKNRK